MKKKIKQNGKRGSYPTEENLCQKSQKSHDLKKIKQKIKLSDIFSGKNIN